MLPRRQASRLHSARSHEMSLEEALLSDNSDDLGPEGRVLYVTFLIIGVGSVLPTFVSVFSCPLFATLHPAL